MSSSSVVTLGLDPSIANTGYAVVSGGKVVSSGLLKTSADSPEPARVWVLFAEVAELIRDFSVDEVAIERFRQFFRNDARKSPTGVLNDFRGGRGRSGRKGNHDRARVNPRSMFLLQAAQTACVLSPLLLRCPVFLYGVSEWKGGARIGKKEIKERVRLIYGLDLSNDNVTDAIMIAHHHNQVRRLPTAKGIRISNDELDTMHALLSTFGGSHVTPG